MARIIGRDEAEGRRLLESVGVRLHRTDDATDAPAELVMSVLAPDSREVRAEVVIEVPADPDSGMGAWHVNGADELHVVQSGRGIMEFVTLDGPVSVAVEGGDVVEIRGAEHRYRPLADQRWVLRFSGGIGADLTATPTGRAGGPWPDA